MRHDSLMAAMGWQDLRALPLVGVLIGVLALGAVMFYLPQSRRLPRRWRWTLTGLRLLALTALALSLLQPIIIRAPKPAERGAIMLVVDHSQGMGIHDRLRRSAQLVALADGLGWLPAGLRSRGDAVKNAVTAARQKFEDLSTAQSRLSFASLSGRSTVEAAAQVSTAFSEFDSAANALLAERSKINPKAQVAAAIENLRKQLQRPRDAGEDEDWLSGVRAALDAVTVAATTFQTGTDQTLYNTNAQVRSICDELQGLSRLGLVEQAIVRPGTGLLSNVPPQTPMYGFAVGDEVTPLALRGGGQPVRRLLLDTEAAGMDLAVGIREALDHLNGVPVAAVVLFSDGRRPVSKPPGASPAVGVPVYAVAVASRGQLQDWSLSHVRIPESVFTGEPFMVLARVHGVGMNPGATVEVRCAVDDAATAIPAKSVTLGADLSADVEFVMTIDEPGSRRIMLQLPPAPTEINSENNRVERWVKVYARKQKVALLAAAPFWDFQYLRDALEARVGNDLHVEVLEGGKCALTPERILQQDAMVLFDVGATWLDAAQWSAVRAIAEERGGLVVLVAGAEHLPAEYGTGALAELLPYWIESVAGTQPMAAGDAKPAWRIWQGEEPVYRFGPAAPGAQRLLFEAADPRAWDTLPPLYRYLSLPPLKPVARPLLVERKTGDPVITTMPLGAGQVAFVGLDETWRWRNKIGRTAQEGVWMQLIRDGTDPPYAVIRGRLSLEVGKAAVSPGEAVDVRVKLVDAHGLPVRLPTAELRVLRDGEFKFQQSLMPVDGAAGRCAGTLLGLPVGNYVLQARADDQIVEYPLHVVRRYEREMEDPSGDRAALERIAKASGGKVLTMEQLRELPPLLAAVESEPHPVTLRLWDSAYLFGFVVACFAAEWALRKRMGLA